MRTRLATIDAERMRLLNEACVDVSNRFIRLILEQISTVGNPADIVVKAGKSVFPIEVSLDDPENSERAESTGRIDCTGLQGTSVIRFAKHAKSGSLLHTWNRFGSPFVRR